MKKIVLIVSMSLLGIALYAAPVTPEKALQVASRVFASGPATKAADASSLQIVWDGEYEPATKAAQDPAFYVVSRPGGGFVIVSGDDNMQPVLAFSFENEFKVEGMPANVRWWMEELKGYARSAVSPTPEILEAWDAFAETKAVIPSAQIDANFLNLSNVLFGYYSEINLSYASWTTNFAFNKATGQYANRVEG
ncbi:MAG: Spi family protease inhibitor, partial [Bacteroidales bacterium]|nr:Spi family protease inhibitor [Bacteroidales bacterium]